MQITGLFVLIYGVIVLSGGIWGYIHAHSFPSLIAGLSFGVALTISSCGLFLKRKFFSYLALGLTLILFSLFLSRFLKAHAFFPSGLMALLSFIMLIITSLQTKRIIKK